MKKFFNLKVTVSEHKTLNTSRGIIKDRALKGESEKDICDYLKNQGVIAVKRFTIKKDPGESLPPCRGLWGTLHTGDDIDCNYCLLWEC